VASSGRRVTIGTALATAALRANLRKSRRVVLSFGIIHISF
jgi:hypothetical protein